MIELIASSQDQFEPGLNREKGIEKLTRTRRLKKNDVAALAENLAL
jgi:hypothetical protein